MLLKTTASGGLHRTCLYPILAFLVDLAGSGGSDLALIVDLSEIAGTNPTLSANTKSFIVSYLRSTLRACLPVSIQTTGYQRFSKHSVRGPSRERRWRRVVPSLASVPSLLCDSIAPNGRAESHHRRFLSTPTAVAAGRSAA